MDVGKEHFLCGLSLLYDLPGSIRQPKMHSPPVCRIFASGQKAPFFQIGNGQGHMALGHAPVADNVRRPIQVRIIRQEQQHIQFILGQIPFFTDGIHQTAITLLRPGHGIKIIKLHGHSSNSSFLNNISIAQHTLLVNN